MSTSLRERLKSETRAEHDAIEQELDMMSPDFTREDYVQVLGVFLRFHEAFERDLQKRSGSAAEFYLPNRSKISWLRNDLQSLRTNESMNLVDSELFRRELPTDEHLWGAIYVIEGSTLGGTFLSRHFANRFGLSPGGGLSYFSSYQDQTRNRWLETLSQLDMRSAGGDDQDAIVEGARRMFRLLRQQIATVTKARSRIQNQEGP